MRAGHRRIRRTITAALATVALLLMAFCPALPVYAAPVLLLAPTSGAVGTAVTVSGSIFSSYEGDNIRIFFDTAEITGSPVRVPDGGSFNVDFNVPAAAASGTHWVEARSDNTTTSVLARKAFTVDTTEITLSADQAVVNTNIDINGSGFYVGSPVTLYYANPDKQKIGTTTSSSTGKFTFSLTVPPGAAGTHKITASNGQGNTAAADFTALPDITLSRAAAGLGDTVTVNGEGFAAGSAVVVTFGAATVASAQTDALGSFQADIEVPDLAALSYTVKAADDKGNSATTEFSFAAGAKLSAVTGAVGSSLTVHGSGFTPGAVITVKYDDSTIATTAADNNGDFSDTFNVPASPGGRHVVAVSDGATTKELSFTVETVAPPMPVLLLPVDNTLTGAQAYFQWSAVPDASVPVTYNLDIASDRNFAADVLLKTGLAAPEYSLTEAETLAAGFKNVPYYWRVKAVDGAGNVSEWSAAQVFFVSVPAAPELKLPAEGGAVQYPIRLSWQAVTGLSMPVTYNLQISAAPVFTAAVLDKTGLDYTDRLVNKSDNLKLKKGTTYYWRVSAVDAAHNNSGWSAVGSFRFLPKSSFPSWAIYTLICLGAAIAVLFAFRLGRKMAFH